MTDPADLNGRVKSGTSGKVRVSVTSVEEFSADTPDPNLKYRTYALHGTNADWNVSVAASGLSSDLIEVGDELDLRVDTSPGYVPLVQYTNQVFGIFATDGKLLLFGAEMKGNTLEPDFSELGLTFVDQGQACGRSAHCNTIDHRANLSDGNQVAELQSGQTARLGDLQIALPSFYSMGPPNGFCDDSGALYIVGFAAPAVE